MTYELYLYKAVSKEKKEKNTVAKQTVFTPVREMS